MTFVDGFATEVKSCPSPPGDDVNEEEGNSRTGDPTDSDIHGSPSGCTDNWKAAASDEKKKMWAVLSESGIFANACRHSFVLWIADMVQSGELCVSHPLHHLSADDPPSAKYLLAMVTKGLELFGSHNLIGYDISCQFGKTIISMSLAMSFK